jgi:preprotein translocase subunit SecE
MDHGRRPDGRPPETCLLGIAELAKLDPAQFVREVRTEVAKVTWPSRKETLITTGLVLAMSALAAVFFLLVDQLVALAMRGVFGLG